MDDRLKISLAGELCTKLWGYYLPEIVSGNPVTFCFHQEIVDSLCLDLFDKYDVEADGRKLIDKVCSLFYDISNESVLVRDSAFADLGTGYSAAIVIVAQQVLAVEDMVRDKSMSEDAYFPRLRVRISSNLGDRSLNPFEYKSFRRVWSKFQEEIFQSGGDRKTITFFGGEGLNKTRSYPISQALLSLEDQFKIRKLYNQGAAKSLSPMLIRELLRKEKYKLSKRGQRLIRNPALRRLVVDQVIGFLGKPTDILHEEKLYQNRQEKVSSESVQIKAYSSFDDWLSDGYSIAMTDSSQRKLSQNESVVHLRSILNTKGYLVLAKDDGFQDHFSFPCQKVLSKDVPKVLVLFSTRDLGFVRNLIKVFVNSKVPESSFEVEHTDLDGEFVIAELKSSDCVKPFVIESGTFQERTGNDSEKLDWIGGVCVDRRANVYLPFAPPTGLTLAGVPLPGNTEVIVNGQTKVLEAFLEEIRNHLPYSFRLTIKSKGDIDLDLIEKRDLLEPECYGIQLDSIRSLSPAPIEVDVVEDNFLFGFHTRAFLDANPLFSFSRIQIAKILDQRGNNWVDIDPKHISRLIAGIDSADINSVVRKICKEKVAAYKKVPKDILSYIEAM